MLQVMAEKQEVKISIYSTIDSTNLSLVDQYLSENFQIVDVENEWPNKILDKGCMK